jgi:Herpesviridae UL52/UL70 DNA primase
MVDAVWDPVTKKVVFVRNEEEEEDNGTKKEETNKSKKEKEHLQWRTDETNDESFLSLSSSHQQANSSNDRRRPRSQGVKPSHPITPQIEILNQAITRAVITRKTQTARAAHDCQRRAYTDLSSYKSFPLQELAVSYYQELRIDWGVDHDEDIASATCPEATLCAASASPSSSTSSSVGSCQQPEPKRHIADHVGSAEQSIQHWKEQFLRQRDSSSSPDPAVFTNPLYSLEPRLWGLEAATTGKRKYVVAHAGRFFDHYWRKSIPADRHAYELIRPNTPCRLYLDIECTTDDFLIANAAVQVELLYELWLRLVQEIEEQFSNFSVNGKCLASLNRRDSLIDLESNSPTKFSRHWILHIKTTDNVEVLFPNNLAVGTFVKGFISRLADDPSWREDYPVLSKYMFLANSNNTCLLDLGVYTRNRIFRLLGSCKFGKAAVLHIARSNQFDLGIANDCVIRSGDVPDTESDVEEQIQESIRRTADWSDHARALAETLVVPLNSSKFTYPLLPIAPEEAVTAPGPKSVQPSTKRTGTAHQRGQSSYPAIEEYILDRFGDRGGTGGRVRVWSIFEDRTLSFQMVDNRWCENIGRQHKSNNIVWNVDLVTHACYQTCHDPDCRGFRGKIYAVPDELFGAPIVKNADDEFFGDEEFEEALASLNIDSVVAEFKAQKGRDAVGDDTKQDTSGEVSLSPEHDSPRGRPESNGNKFASWLDSDDSDASEVDDSPHDEELTKPNGAAQNSPDIFQRDHYTVDPMPLIPHCSESSFKEERPESYTDESEQVQRSTALKVAIDKDSLNLSNKQDFASWLDSPLNENTDAISVNKPGPANETEQTNWLSAGRSREAADRPIISVEVKSCHSEDGKFASWLDSPGNESAYAKARHEKTAPIMLSSKKKKGQLLHGKDLIIEASLSSNDGFASCLGTADNDAANDKGTDGDNRKATTKFASWLDSDSSDDE